ncbi:MAG: knotted carbamoyltransferase YgeW [SAR324 cluster bacterium]|nr:knotted carbamoyltransferase YgeW [SAR324 cluster bacterium]MBL7034245.1 knotted carbamoyltransferase YgeW [SAR324 cluster bacterium]
MNEFEQYLANLDNLNPGGVSSLCQKDLLLTWENSPDELKSIFNIADSLKYLHSNNISAKLFESGIAVSLFRDNSTRTRFSYSSAANLLGLSVQDLDEGKSQIAHGETVRETANMISFLSEAIGIRDDMYLGAGNAFMREVADSLDYGKESGVLNQRPALVNLQCDMDHPTQSMADFLHLTHHFGSIENLRGKKIAMTWAYSPSYGKPLSVPQGIIALMARFGMNVSLAHPEGYELIPEIVETAGKFAAESGGSFSVSNSMDEAFENADIVYPKSWAPYKVMEQRTGLLREQDMRGLDDLEKSCLAQNARHKNWECTEEKMKLTKNGEALYMHCLPADISNVSCEQGEVAASVFEKYRTETYVEAGYKPFIIAAMILANRFENPVATLESLMSRGTERIH